MATVPASVKTRANSSGSKDVIVTWTGITNVNLDGQWVSIPGVVVRSIGYSGVWGAAPVLNMRASNGDAMQEKATDVVITGAQADEVTLSGPFAANGLTGNLYQAAGAYRPLFSGGDVTTNLTVTLYGIQD